jgi:hypothetical protein
MLRKREYKVSLNERAIAPQLDAAIDSNIDKTIRERESVRGFK